MRIRIFSASAAVALAFSLVACGNDVSTAPRATSAASSRDVLFTSSVTGETTVIPVIRTHPLKNAIVVSKVIDSKGGDISIAGAGLKLIVPPGAVLTKTKFTLTALAGDDIAYEFEPHGTRFPVALTMQQSTQDLAVVGDAPIEAGMWSVGYFADASDPTKTTETLPILFDYAKQTANVQIWHFSGYIFASGRR